ncbi:uncharacterized protein [Physcomitrium patens]|uniref:uncharacterized protein isoform X2 n=1 Tax=Physcomitrium patens TaxID=3218 RepID=UPI003CCD2023
MRKRRMPKCSASIVFRISCNVLITTAEVSSLQPAAEYVRAQVDTAFGSAKNDAYEIDTDEDFVTALEYVMPPTPEMWKDGQYIASAWMWWVRSIFCRESESSVW